MVWGAESSESGEVGVIGDCDVVYERRGSSLNMSSLSDSIRAGMSPTSTPFFAYLPLLKLGFIICCGRCVEGLKYHNMFDCLASQIFLSYNSSQALKTSCKLALNLGALSEVILVYSCCSHIENLTQVLHVQFLDDFTFRPFTIGSVSIQILMAIASFQQ